MPTTEDTIYLEGAGAELKRLLAALNAANVDAPNGTTQDHQDAAYDRIEGRIQGLMNSPRLRELLVDVQETRLAEVQAEIVTAFTPFFDSPDRCRIAAQNTDAFSREQRRLSTVQVGGVPAAKVALEILELIFGAE